MITQDQLRGVVGATAYDRDGDKIGKVGQVYYDDATDQPTWVTVNTGFFGTQESFVPVSGAELTGDRVTLAYDKATVKDAPKIAEDGHLSPQEEQQLYRYYGVDYGTGQAAGQAAGRNTAYDDAPGARGPRHVGPDHRHRDDPLRGAAPGRHPDPGGRHGAAAQARRDRAPAGERAGVARGGHPRA